VRSSGGFTPKSKRYKRREAAKKAWETIRKKKELKKLKEAESTLKINSFITPTQISRIKHPEDFSRLFLKKG